MSVDDLFNRGRILFPKFRGTDEQLRGYLEESVEDFSKFFEPDISFEDATQLYETVVEIYGEPFAHQFRFSLRGTDHLSKALRRLVEVGNEGMASNNSHLLVLQHIGLLEAVELGGYVSFPDWLRGGVESDKIPLPTAIDRESFRDYVDERNKEYLEEHGTSRALRCALAEGLTYQDKVKLLMAYTFSKPFRLGESTKDHRHLHCASRTVKHRKYCLSSCKPPSRAEAETGIEALARKFYEMRSAFAHRATGTVFAHPDLQRGAGGSIYDVYFLNDGRIVEYEVSLANDSLLAIFRRCLISRIRPRIPVANAQGLKGLENNRGRSKPRETRKGCDDTPFLKSGRGSVPTEARGYSDSKPWLSNFNVRR